MRQQLLGSGGVPPTKIDFSITESINQDFSTEL